MSEITEQEAREASSTHEECSRKFFAGELFGIKAHDDFSRSGTTLIEFARQELSRRDDDRAERGKPIDAEWFRKNGNEVCSIFVCRDGVEYEIEWAAGTPGVGIDLTIYSGPRKCFCHTVHIPHITTRGQLLDLLKALRGGT